MNDLFASAAEEQLTHLAPLAERMRPRTLDELVGQPQLLDPRRGLRTQLEAGRLQNVLLVGPPGSGKTTVARLLAAASGLELESLSAVSASVTDVRRVVADAKARLGANQRRTALFLDEVHRFNRAQQDALLPSIEDGTITLVGATTENPYVSLNRALLSRTIVFELQPHTPDALSALLDRAAHDAVRGLARDGAIEVAPDAAALIVDRSGGDARAALTLLEAASFPARASQGSAMAARISAEHVEAASDRRAISHDRTGDRHYDTISAYIKSMRAGQADDALRYLATMLVGGEDPMFVARRLVIFASEDVGPGDPRALLMATAALQMVLNVGMPEARIGLAQVTRYCAEAPKDRQAINDIAAAMQAVEDRGSPTIPVELTNRKGHGHSA